MDSRTVTQKGRSEQWDDTDSRARSGGKQKAHKENLENGKRIEITRYAYAVSQKMFEP